MKQNIGEHDSGSSRFPVDGTPHLDEETSRKLSLKKKAVMSEKSDTSPDTSSRISGVEGLGSAVQSGVTATGAAVKGGMTAAGTVVQSGVTATGSAVKGGIAAAGSAVQSGMAAAGTVVQSGVTAAPSVINKGKKLYQDNKDNLTDLEKTIDTAKLCELGIDIYGGKLINLYILTNPVTSSNQNEAKNFIYDKEIIDSIFFKLFKDNSIITQQILQKIIISILLNNSHVSASHNNWNSSLLGDNKVYIEAIYKMDEVLKNKHLYIFDKLTGKYVNATLFTLIFSERPNGTINSIKNIFKRAPIDLSVNNSTENNTFEEANELNKKNLINNIFTNLGHEIINVPVINFFREIIFSIQEDLMENYDKLFDEALSSPKLQPELYNSKIVEKINNLSLTKLTNTLINNLEFRLLQHAFLLKIDDELYPNIYIYNDFLKINNALQSSCNSLLRDKLSNKNSIKWSKHDVKLACIFFIHNELYFELDNFLNKYPEYRTSLEKLNNLEEHLKQDINSLKSGPPEKGLVEEEDRLNCAEIIKKMSTITRKLLNKIFVGIKIPTTLVRHGGDLLNIVNSYIDLIGDDIGYLMRITIARNKVIQENECDFNFLENDLSILSFADLWSKKIRPHLNKCLEPMLDKRNAATSISYINALKKSFTCAYSGDNSDELQSKCGQILEEYKTTGLKDFMKPQSPSNKIDQLKLVKFLQLKIMEDFCGSNFTSYSEEGTIDLENEELQLETVLNKNTDISKFRPFLLIINRAFKPTEVVNKNGNLEAHRLQNSEYTNTLLPEDLTMPIETIMSVFSDKLINSPQIISYWLKLYKKQIFKMVGNILESDITTVIVDVVSKAVATILNNIVHVIDNKITISPSDHPLSKESFKTYISYKLYKNKILLHQCAEYLIFFPKEDQFCKTLNNYSNKSCIQPKFDGESVPEEEEEKLIMDRKIEIFKTILANKAKYFRKNIDTRNISSNINTFCISRKELPSSPAEAPAPSSATAEPAAPSSATAEPEAPTPAPTTRLGRPRRAAAAALARRNTDIAVRTTSTPPRVSHAMAATAMGGTDMGQQHGMRPNLGSAQEATDERAVIMARIKTDHPKLGRSSGATRLPKKEEEKKDEQSPDANAAKKKEANDARNSRVERRSASKTGDVSGTRAVSRTGREKSLILHKSGNNNGAQYCWLNATLYAFTAFEPVLNLVDTFRCDQIPLEKDDTVNIIGVGESSGIYLITVTKITGNEILVRIESDLMSGENLETWYSDIIDTIDRIHGNNPSKITPLSHSFDSDKKRSNIFGRVNKAILEKISRVSRDTREVIRSKEELIETLKRARSPDTIWNGDFYKRIHQLICDITDNCGYGSDGDIASVPEDFNHIQYGNPQPVIDIFKNILTNFCGSNDKNPITIDASEITHKADPKLTEFKKEKSGGRKLIAVIKAERPLPKINMRTQLADEERVYGHFTSVVKSDLNGTDDSWRKYDSGITNTNLFRFEDAFPADIASNEAGEHLAHQVWGIYFKEPEHVLQGGQLGGDDEVEDDGGDGNGDDGNNTNYRYPSGRPVRTDHHSIGEEVSYGMALKIDPSMINQMALGKVSEIAYTHMFKNTVIDNFVKTGTPKNTNIRYFLVKYDDNYINNSVLIFKIHQLILNSPLLNLPIQTLSKIITLSQHPLIMVLKSQLNYYKNMETFIKDIISVIKQSPKLLYDILSLDYYISILVQSGKGPILQAIIYLMEKCKLDVLKIKTELDKITEVGDKPRSLSSSEFNNLKGFLYSKPSDDNELINTNEYNTVIHKILDLVLALQPTSMDILSELSDIVVSKQIDESRVLKLTTQVLALDNILFKNNETELLVKTLLNSNNLVTKADIPYFGILSSIAFQAKTFKDNPGEFSEETLKQYSILAGSDIMKTFLEPTESLLSNRDVISDAAQDIADHFSQSGGQFSMNSLKSNKLEGIKKDLTDEITEQWNSTHLDIIPKEKLYKLNKYLDDFSNNKITLKDMIQFGNKELNLGKIMSGKHLINKMVKYKAYMNVIDEDYHLYDYMRIIEQNIPESLSGTITDGIINLTSKNIIKEGDTVKAKNNASKKYYDGVINNDNLDGTYYVLFSNGLVDKSVPYNSIKFTPRVALDYNQIVNKFWSYFSNRCSKKDPLLTNYSENDSDLDRCLFDATLELIDSFVEETLNNFKSTEGKLGELLQNLDVDDFKNNIITNVKDFWFSFLSIANPKILILENTLKSLSESENQTTKLTNLINYINKKTGFINVIRRSKRITKKDAKYKNTMIKNKLVYIYKDPKLIWEDIESLSKETPSSEISQELINSAIPIVTKIDKNEQNLLIMIVRLTTIAHIDNLNNFKLKEVYTLNIDSGLNRELSGESCKDKYINDHLSFKKIINNYINDISAFKPKQSNLDNFTISNYKTFKVVQTVIKNINITNKELFTMNLFSKEGIVSDWKESLIKTEKDKNQEEINLKYKNFTKSYESIPLVIKSMEQTFSNKYKQHDIFSKEQQIWFDDINYSGDEEYNTPDDPINNTLLRNNLDKILRGSNRWLLIESQQYESDSYINLSKLGDTSIMSQSDDPFLVKNEALKNIQQKIYNLFTAFKLFSPNLIEYEKQFKIIIKIILTVLDNISRAKGVELLVNQQIHGFIYTLIKPSAKLHKTLKNALNSFDLLRIAKAVSNIMATNLPTLLHKIVQIVEPIIKEIPAAKEVFEDWWGKKLTYPMMGNIEVDNIFKNISIPKYYFIYKGSKLLGKEKYQNHSDYEIGYYLNLMAEYSMNSSLELLGKEVNGEKKSTGRYIIPYSIWNKIEDEFSLSEFNPIKAIKQVFNLDPYTENERYEKYDDVNIRLEWANISEEVSGVEAISNDNLRGIISSHEKAILNYFETYGKITVIRKDNQRCVYADFINYVKFLLTLTADDSKIKQLKAFIVTKFDIETFYNCNSGIIVKSPRKILFTNFEQLFPTDKGSLCYYQKEGTNDQSLLLCRGEIIHKKLNEKTSFSGPFPLSASVGQVHIYYSNESALSTKIKDHKDTDDNNNSISYLGDNNSIYLSNINKYSLIKAENELYRNKLLYLQKTLSMRKHVQMSTYFKFLSRLNNEITTKFSHEKIRVNDHNLKDLYGSVVTMQSQKILSIFYQRFLSYNSNENNWCKININKTCYNGLISHNASTNNWLENIQKIMKNHSNIYPPYIEELVVYNNKTKKSRNMNFRDQRGGIINISEIKTLWENTSIRDLIIIEENAPESEVSNFFYYKNNTGRVNIFQNYETNINNVGVLYVKAKKDLLNQKIKILAKEANNLVQQIRSHEYSEESCKIFNNSIGNFNSNNNLIRELFTKKRSKEIQIDINIPDINIPPEDELSNLTEKNYGSKICHTYVNSIYIELTNIVVDESKIKDYIFNILGENMYNNGSWKDDTLVKIRRNQKTWPDIFRFTENQNKTYYSYLLDNLKFYDISQNDTVELFKHAYDNFVKSAFANDILIHIIGEIFNLSKLTDEDITVKTTSFAEKVIHNILDLYKTQVDGRNLVINKIYDVNNLNDEDTEPILIFSSDKHKITHNGVEIHQENINKTLLNGTFSSTKINKLISDMSGIIYDTEIEINSFSLFLTSGPFFKIPISVLQKCCETCDSIEKFVVLQNLLNSTYFRETLSFKKQNTSSQSGENTSLIPSSNFITLTDLYSNWKSEFMHQTSYSPSPKRTKTDSALPAVEEDLKTHLKKCVKQENVNYTDESSHNYYERISYLPIFNINTLSGSGYVAKHSFLETLRNTSGSGINQSNVECQDIFRKNNFYNNSFSNCYITDPQNNRVKRERPINDMPFFSQEGGDRNPVASDIDVLDLSTSGFFKKIIGLNLDSSEFLFDDINNTECTILDIQQLLLEGKSNSHFSIGNALNMLDLSDKQFELFMNNYIDKSGIINTYEETKDIVDQDFLKQYKFNTISFNENIIKMSKISDSINNIVISQPHKETIIKKTDYDLFRENFKSNILYEKYIKSGGNIEDIQSDWQNIKYKFDRIKHQSTFKTLLDTLKESESAEDYTRKINELKLTLYGITKDVGVKKSLDNLKKYVEDNYDKIINLVNNNIRNSLIWKYTHNKNISTDSIFEEYERIYADLDDEITYRFSESSKTSPSKGNNPFGLLNSKMMTKFLKQSQPAEKTGRDDQLKLIADRINSSFDNFFAESNNIINKGFIELASPRKVIKLPLEEADIIKIKINVATEIMFILTNNYFSVENYFELTNSVEPAQINYAEYILNSRYACKTVDQHNLKHVAKYENLLNTPEDVLKFIKIRSRMMMCIEQSVFPESLNEILRSLREIDDPNWKGVENMLKYLESTLRCKIKDVLGEFDLWEEITYTMEAKQLYDFPPDKISSQYDYEIKVAEVSKTFDEIRPLYTVPNKQSELIYIDKLGCKRKVKRGLYAAVIQDKMRGDDVKDYIDRGDFDNIDGPDHERAEEFKCLQKAMGNFLAIYISKIISPGKYHGDPHAGNIKWDYDKKTKFGRLSPIDFGDWVTISSQKLNLVFSIGIFTSLVTFLHKQHILGFYINPSLVANLFLIGLNFEEYSNEALLRIIRRNNMIEKEYIDSIEIYIKNRLITDFEGVSKIRELLINVTKDTMKTRILKRFDDTLPEFSVSNLISLLQDQSFLTNLVGELIDKDAEGADWECETLGKEIITLIQALTKIFNTANKFIDSGGIMDIVFSVLLQLCPDEETKKVISAMLQYLKTFLAASMLSKSGGSLSTILQNIYGVINTSGLSTLPNILISGLSLNTGGTNKHIKLDNNLLENFKKASVAGAATLAFTPLLVKLAGKIINFAPLSVYISGAELVGKAIVHSDNIHKIELQEYDGLEELGGKQKLDHIKKLIDRSYSGDMITEFVSTMIEILCNASFKMTPSKIEKLKIISSTRDSLTKSGTILSESFNKLAYAAGVNDLLKKILLCNQTIYHTNELFISKAAKLYDGVSGIVKTIYGQFGRKNLLNNFYFSSKGIIFKTKPVIYDVDNLPDSVTDNYKHNDAIDSVGKLYANLELNYTTNDPTERVTINDPTFAITHNNYRRLPNQLLTNYSFFNNFKTLLNLYDYLSESVIQNYQDDPDSLKNMIFNHFSQELDIYIYLTNKVRVSDFLKKINSIEFKDIVTQQSLEIITQKLDELKASPNLEIYKIILNNLTTTANELKINPKYNSDKSRIMEVAYINNIRKLIVDETRYLNKDAMSLNEGFYYEYKTVNYGESNYQKLTGNTKNFIINPNDIVFWNIDKLNDKKNINMITQFDDYIPYISKEGSEDSVIYKTQTPDFEKIKNYLSHLKKWIHSKIKINKTQYDVVSKVHTNVNKIVGFIFNKVRNLDVGNNIFFKNINEITEIKISDLKMIKFYSLLYHTTVPFWTINNVIPRIVLSIQNKISHIHHVEKDIIDKISVEHLWKKSCLSHIDSEEQKKADYKNLGKIADEQYYKEMTVYYNSLSNNMKFELEAICNERFINALDKDINSNKNRISLDSLIFDYITDELQIKYIDKLKTDYNSYQVGMQPQTSQSTRRRMTSSSGKRINNMETSEVLIISDAPDDKEYHLPVILDETKELFPSVLTQFVSESWSEFKTRLSGNINQVRDRARDNQYFNGDIFNRQTFIETNTADSPCGIFKGNIISKMWQGDFTFFENSILKSNGVVSYVNSIENIKGFDKFIDFCYDKINDTFKQDYPEDIDTLREFESITEEYKNRTLKHIGISHIKKHDIVGIITKGALISTKGLHIVSRLANPRLIAVDLAVYYGKSYLISKHNYTSNMNYLRNNTFSLATKLKDEYLEFDKKYETTLNTENSIDPHMPTEEILEYQEDIFNYKIFTSGDSDKGIDIFRKGFIFHNSDEDIVDKAFTSNSLQTFTGKPSNNVTINNGSKYISHNFPKLVQHIHSINSYKYNTESEIPDDIENIAKFSLQLDSWYVSNQIYRKFHNEISIVEKYIEMNNVDLNDKINKGNLIGGKQDIKFNNFNITKLGGSYNKYPVDSQSLAYMVRELKDFVDKKKAKNLISDEEYRTINNDISKSLGKRDINGVFTIINNKFGHHPCITPNGICLDRAPYKLQYVTIENIEQESDTSIIRLNSPHPVDKTDFIDKIKRMNDYGYNMRNYIDFDTYIDENKQLSVIVNRPPELMSPTSVFREEFKKIKNITDPLFGHTLKLSRKFMCDGLNIMCDTVVANIEGTQENSILFNLADDVVKIPNMQELISYYKITRGVNNIITLDKLVGMQNYTVGKTQVKYKISGNKHEYLVNIIPVYEIIWLQIYNILHDETKFSEKIILHTLHKYDNLDNTLRITEILNHINLLSDKAMKVAIKQLLTNEPDTPPTDDAVLELSRAIIQQGGGVKKVLALINLIRVITNPEDGADNLSRLITNPVGNVHNLSSLITNPSDNVQNLLGNIPAPRTYSADDASAWRTTNTLADWSKLYKVKTSSLDEVKTDQMAWVSPVSEEDTATFEKLIHNLIELVILPHIVLMSKEPQSNYSKFLDKYNIYTKLRDAHIDGLDSADDEPWITNDPIWKNRNTRDFIIKSYTESTDIDNSQILQYFYKKILDKEYQVDE